MSGSSAICFCSITVPSAADTVSTTGVAALTVTVCSIAEGLSVTSMTLSLPTASRTPRRTVPNPDSDTPISYGAGSRFVTVNRPSLSVTVVCDTPVSLLTMVTVAPGRTPPVLSVTVPRMVARTAWAATGDGAIHETVTRQTAAARRRITMLLSRAKRCCATRALCARSPPEQNRLSRYPTSRRSIPVANGRR